MFTTLNVIVHEHPKYHEETLIVLAAFPLYYDLYLISIYAATGVLRKNEKRQFGRNENMYSCFSRI